MTGTVTPRRGREGSRWFNERPTGEEIAEWFKSIPLHEGMRHERYLGGIVLIEQSAKFDEVTSFTDQGRPIIARRTKEGDGRVEHLTYTPYPKVETRVQYFWDLMALHPDWMGVIEPIGGDPAIGPGFSKRTLAGSKNGKAVNHLFIACQMRVVVYERESYAERIVNNGRSSEVVKTGRTVVAGPPATKLVPLNNRWGDVDPFVMMKAETGAVGRALGMAGMLVVPGAGVATAEDMHEQATLEGRVEEKRADSGAEAATLPAEEPVAAPPAEDLRKMASEAVAALKAEAPQAFEQFQEWAKGRGVTSLNEAPDAALKGIIKKAQKDLEAARQAAAEAATEEATGG